MAVGHGAEPSVGFFYIASHILVQKHSTELIVYMQNYGGRMPPMPSMGG